MIQTQKKYLDYVQKVQECLDKNIGRSEFTQPFSFGKMIEGLQKAKLLVPVVGGFSTGKSTLINSFLGEKVLPVGITPETALATELHFSEEEYIETLQTNDQTEKFALSDMVKITEKAKEYKSMKVYLNQRELKTLFPLVLVDMPGFDAPIETHNKAILEYLDKGSHYIFLVTIEDGNITRSIKSQIETIQETGASFSFFLSKSNLKSESDVQEVQKKIEEQIEEDFDFKSPVIPITQEGGENLQKTLEAIDRENLFKNNFLGFIKLEYYDKIINALDTTIQSLNRDTKQNDKEIEELKKGLKEIETKKEEMILEADSKYTNANQIVQNIGNDISDIVDELVEIENLELLKQRLNDELRNSFMHHVNSSLQEMVSSVQNSFSSILNSIETQNTAQLSNQILAATDLLSKSTKGIKGLQIAGKFGAVGIMLTNILNPLLAVVSLFLPDIIQIFIKKSNKNKLKNQILTQIIPSMKAKLQGEISILFIDKKKEIIKQIGESFKSQIEEKAEQIQQAEKQRKEKIQNIEEEIQKYKQGKNEIQNLAKKYEIEG